MPSPSARANLWLCLLCLLTPIFCGPVGLFATAFYRFSRSDIGSVFHGLQARAWLVAFPAALVALNRACHPPRRDWRAPAVCAFLERLEKVRK